MRKTTVTKRGVTSTRRVTYSYDPDQVVTSSIGSNFTAKTVSRDEIVKSSSVNGWRPPLPYTASWMETSGLHGTWGWRQKSGKYDPYATYDEDGYLGSVGRLLDPSDVFDSAALSRALSNLKAQQVNLGMVIASRRQTIDHLAETAKRFFYAYSAFRRGDYKSASKHLGVRLGNYRSASKDASKAWLEYNFAWRPLINDLYGIASEATRKFPDDGDIVVVRGTSRSTETKSGESIVRSTTSPTTRSYADITSVSRRDSRCSLWYKLDSGALHAAVRNGLINPAYVVWDLVPFSFVIDWALPIGEYLNNLDAQIGFTYLGGSSTVYDTVTTTATNGRKTGETDNFKIANQSYSGHRIDGAMRRRVLPEPSPASTFYLKNPFSTWSVATAAALARQIMKRG